jgi:hypothetical protein
MEPIEIDLAHLSKRKRIAFGAVTILLGLILGLLTTELVLRLIMPEKMFYRINISSTDGNYVLTENPRLIYVPAPNTGDFNSYGHRGRSFPLKRAAGKESS